MPPETAECLVVNTCAFIDRAREESVNTILELAQLKERGRARALIVTGCLTQRYGGEILKRDPRGQRHPRHLRARPHRRAREPGGRPPRLGDERAARATSTTPRRRGCLTARLPYAYVKIAEGCDMGCTFCAIPQFRGKHRSRPLAGHRRRGRGAGRARHPGGDPRLPGHARLWPRPARQRRYRRSAARAVRHARCRGSGRCTCTPRTSTTA